MTQQELADKSGIPKTHISQIISGTIKIEAYRARKIEIALDLPKYSIVSKVGFPRGEREKKRLKKIDEEE